MFSPTGGGITAYDEMFILKSTDDKVHDIAFGNCPNLSIWRWDKQGQQYKHLKGEATYF